MVYCGLTLGMEPVLVTAEITSCSRLCVGASLPNIPGRRGDALQPHARLNSGFSGLGPGMLFYHKALAYPEHVNPHRQTKSYCSEDSHYHMNLHL